MQRMTGTLKMGMSQSELAMKWRFYDAGSTALRSRCIRR